MTPTDTKLALKWGCDTRTIRRWRKAGAPLSSAKQMAVWLASRKNLPPGTQAILAGQQAKSMSASAAGSESAGNIGAAGALRRLEDVERTTFQLLEVALRSGNPSAIKASRENWLAISNQLRQYDLAVAKDRRDSGDLVARAEMELAAEAFVYWLRMAGLVSCRKMAGMLAMTRDTVTISNALKEEFWDTMLSSLAAMGCKEGKLHVPKWWLAAASKGMDGSFSEYDKCIANRQQALEAAFERIVSISADRRTALVMAALPPAEPTPAPQSNTL